MADARKTLEILIKGRNRSGPAWRSLRRQGTRAVTAITTTIATLGSSLLNLRTLIAGAGIAAGIKALFAPAVSADRALGNLKILLGGMRQAKDLYADLEKFAASTPLQMPLLLDLSKLLLTFADAKDILPTLRMLGDIAQGDSEKMSRLASAYAKVAMLGKASMEEIRQFGEAGVPIMAALADSFDTTTGEIGAMITRGEIGFPELKKALEGMTEAGGLFAGSMADAAQGTSGLISTLKDNLSLLLKELADKSLPDVNRGIEEMIDLLGDLRDEADSGAGAGAGAIKTYAEAFANLATSIRYASDAAPGGIAGLISTGLTGAMNIINEIGYQIEELSTGEVNATLASEAALQALRDKRANQLADQKSKEDPAEEAADPAATKAAEKAAEKARRLRLAAAKELARDVQREIDARLKLADEINDTEADIAAEHQRLADRANADTIRADIDRTDARIDAAENAARNERESARKLRREADAAWKKILAPKDQKDPKAKRKEEADSRQAERREKRAKETLARLQKRFFLDPKTGKYIDMEDRVASKKSTRLLQAGATQRAADQAASRAERQQQIADTGRQQLISLQDRLAATTADNTTALRDLTAKLSELQKDGPTGGPLPTLDDYQLRAIATSAAEIIAPDQAPARAARKSIIDQATDRPSPIPDLPPTSPVIPEQTTPTGRIIADPAEVAAWEELSPEAQAIWSLPGGKKHPGDPSLQADQLPPAMAAMEPIKPIKPIKPILPPPPLADTVIPGPLPAPISDLPPPPLTDGSARIMEELRRQTAHLAAINAREIVIG